MRGLGEEDDGPKQAQTHWRHHRGVYDALVGDARNGGGGTGTAAEKIAAMRAAGIHVSESAAGIAEIAKELLG